MYKLSVVIPVYNAENCLENAIESIINQNIGFENIELILVDDNSNDNSKMIIEKYSNKYNNIISFFSDENHGFPGFGRNKGIDLASSDYVMFMDNDDELDCQMCNKLYEAIVNFDADISCCDVKEIDDVSEITHKMGPDSKEDHVILQDDELFECNTGLVWNKLFKRDIIKKFNIKFLTDNYCDDQAFSIEYMLNVNKLVYLHDYIGYFWLRRNESLSNSKELNSLETLFEGYDYILNLFIEKDKRHLIYTVANSGTLYLLGQSVLLKSNQDKKRFLEKIYDFEEKCDFNVKLNNPFFSVINYFLLKRKFNISIFIMSFYKKLGSSSFLLRIYKNLVN